MDFPKADLIMHPVRFRIMQILMGTELTTQDIAEQMPDVPKSSIYRHLKQLLEGNMISIADTALVHGIQEKRYRLLQQPYLGPEDVAGMSPADHLRYFTIYILSVLQGFHRYLEAFAGPDGDVDMVADRAGYTESYLYLDRNELNQFQQGLNKLILQFAQNGPGPDRQKQKIALITHPEKDKNDGTIE